MMIIRKACLSLILDENIGSSQGSFVASTYFKLESAFSNKLIKIEKEFHWGKKSAKNEPGKDRPTYIGTVCANLKRSSLTIYKLL